MVLLLAMSLLIYMMVLRKKNVKDNAYMPSHLTKRYTLVEEISSLATFLASDSSNNIIGQIISVDGGCTLQ